MSRLTIAVAVLMTATACSSNWTLTLDAAQECTDARLKAWWADTDGDGWGDPGTDPIMECRGEQEDSLVRNDLDCDINDPEITGDVGAVCPLDLPATDAPQTIALQGKRSGDVEFVAFLGDSPRSWSMLAEADCQFWGAPDSDGDGLSDAGERTRGSDPTVFDTDGGGTSDGAEVSSDDTDPTDPSDDAGGADVPATWGKLATFDTVAQWGELRTELETALGGAEFAAWIGIASDAGAWSWTDTADVSAINGIGWCDGQEPDANAFTRAAIVHRGGGNWCLSSPDAAAGYTRDSAHYICERQAPDPGHYNWHPLQE